MEYNTVIIVILAIFVAIGILSAVVNREPSPEEIGEEGEYIVRRWIETHLSSEEYLSVHDVVLPTTRGETQIDHIVLSLYGVFVIETKNYTG